MLNSDLHNAANKRKMRSEEFVRNNRGLDGGADLPVRPPSPTPAPYTAPTSCTPQRELLEAMYDRIAREPFATLPDDTDALLARLRDIRRAPARRAARHRHRLTPRRSPAPRAGWAESVAAAERKLVAEGAAIEVDDASNSRLGRGKRRRHVLLLDDRLLLCKQARTHPRSTCGEAAHPGPRRFGVGWRCAPRCRWMGPRFRRSAPRRTRGGWW